MADFIWSLVYTDKAIKSLKKVDKPARQRLRKYLESVAAMDDPRQRGKPLTATKRGLWAYRQGGYRVLCDIHDERVVIVIVDAGPRKDIYDT